MSESEGRRISAAGIGWAVWCGVNCTDTNAPPHSSYTKHKPHPKASLPPPPPHDTHTPYIQPFFKTLLRAQKPHHPTPPLPSPKQHTHTHKKTTTTKQVATFPFVFVALGAALATAGFASVEPVLSEHLMTTLHVRECVCVCMCREERFGRRLGHCDLTYHLPAPTYPNTHTHTHSLCVTSHIPPSPTHPSHAGVHLHVGLPHGHPLRHVHHRGAHRRLAGGGGGLSPRPLHGCVWVFLLFFPREEGGR